LSVFCDDIAFFAIFFVVKKRRFRIKLFDYFLRDSVSDIILADKNKIIATNMAYESFLYPLFLGFALMTIRAVSLIISSPFSNP